MNAVSIKQNTEVQTAMQPQLSIIPSDVIVPRLLLMQSTSDFVKERKANYGDLVRSTTVEKLGDQTTKIKFIPLAAPQKFWRVEFKTPGASRWKMKKMEPRTAQNDGLPWKFNADENGQETPAPTTYEWRRVKVLSLYALLPSDIEAEKVEMEKVTKGEMPDLSKALTPVMLSFSVTSYKAGKEVVTFFTQAASFKMQAWKYMLTLGVDFEENDKGSYAIFTVDRAKPEPVNEAYLPKVAEWEQLVASTELKVDEAVEDVAEETAGPSENF